MQPSPDNDGSTMISVLDSALLAAQQAVYEHAVQPVLLVLGEMRLAELAYDATEWPVMGVLEFAVMVPVMMALERAFPVEAVHDRRAVITDMFYALLHRIGVFPVLAFLLLTPVFDSIEGLIRLGGFSRPDLDALWPGLTDRPLVSFLMYLIVLDFVDYWIHRGQHAWRWWWELHAVHHSQRQMTFWSDERNHLFDDLLRDAILAVVALLIGVAPGQFVWLVVASRVIQRGSMPICDCVCQGRSDTSSSDRSFIGATTGLVWVMKAGRRGLTLAFCSRGGINALARWTGVMVSSPRGSATSCTGASMDGGYWRSTGLRCAGF